MSEKVSKPKQFWISEECSHGNYFHTVDFADNGWENAIHVIELAPMLKMMEEMAELLKSRECDKTINYKGSAMFNKHDPNCSKCKFIESYKTFKRENGLE